MFLTPAGRSSLVPFAVVLAQFVVVNFLLVAPAAIALPLSRELDLTPGQLGLLGSSFLFAYALMQLPVGLLLDAQGPRRTLLISMGLMAAGTAVFATTPSYAWAVLGRGLSGVGGAMVFVPMVSLVHRWFPLSRFGTFFGLANSVGFGGGVVLATAPLAWAAERWGWRAPFGAAWLVSLLVLVLLWAVLRDPDRGPPSGRAPGSLGRRLAAGLGAWAGTPTLWTYSLVLLIVNGTFLSFQGLWAGPYARTVLGLDGAALGAFLLLMPIGSIIGLPAGGIISDRLGSRRRVILLGSAAYVLMWSGQAGHLMGLSAWSPQVGVFLMAFLMGFILVGFGLVGPLAPAGVEGLVTGIVNTSGFLGSAVFQTLTGFMVGAASVDGRLTRAGFLHSFALLAVAAALAVAVSTRIQEPRIQEPQPQPAAE